MKHNNHSRGFTIIELLFTMAILIMMASSFLRVYTSGISREKLIQIKAEMSAIASMLELYRDKYGDYPRVDVHNDLQGYILCSALQGKIDPYGYPTNGHNLLTSEFTISDNGYILDTFGSKYIYLYKTKSSPKIWERDSYILISLGMKSNQISEQEITKDSTVHPNGEISALNSSDIILSNTGFIE